MIGKTINQYKVLEKLGGGGMGVVYKAQDRKLERLVALKFLPPHLGHDEAEKKRFIHEAKAASALDHNNICNIHDIGETDDGQLFIVMAYYAGETVKKKIEKGPLSVAESLDITDQIAQGLSKAHNHDILHRDIKPANVMVTEEGVAKIVDFGLAKLAGKTKLTKTGSTVGTVAYMSPEQGEGSKVDARSDLWSLGVVLFEMLTGELPFTGDYEQAVIYSILNLPPSPVSELRSDLPEGLADVVSKCLMKAPDDRYANIREFREALEPFMETRKPGKRPVSKSRASRLRKSLGIAIPIFLVILLSGLWGGLFSSWGSIASRLGFKNSIPNEKYVTVLPFGSQDQSLQSQVYSAGLSETLTDRLTLLEQFNDSLWVVPSSEIVKNGVQTVADAWDKFKTRLVFTGEVESTESDTRLTLRLMDAESGRPWARRNLVASSRDASILQDSAVVVMAQMAELAVSAQSRKLIAKGVSSSATALSSYVQGCGYLSDQEKEGHIDLAISLFKEAIDEDPDYVLAYVGLSRAYLLKYDKQKDQRWLDEASANCKEAVRLSENSSVAHYTLGQIHFKLGEYDLALQEFAQVIDLDPANDEAYREMAKLYNAQNKPDEAETHYLKATAAAPRYWMNNSYLGVHYYFLDSLDQAAAQFQRVIELKPDYMSGYRNLSGIYFFQDKFDEAKAVLEPALELEPDQITYSQLGTIYFFEGRFGEAAELFRKARDLSPNDYRFWGHMAYAYIWIPGNENQARELSRQAANLAENELNSKPDDAELLCDLANYFAMMRKGEKAEAFIKRAQNSEPLNKNLCFQIGEIYEQLGKREVALQWLEKAIELGISMYMINHSPFLTNLRLDAGFLNLIDKTKSD